MMGVSLIWVSYISFSTFDIILALTAGGPGRATELISVYMYQIAFLELDFGQGSVLMVMLLTFNTLLSLVYLRFFRLRRPPLQGRDMNALRAAGTMTGCSRW